MNLSKGGRTVPSDDDTTSDVDSSHLKDIDDGCGCAEVWEALSERRDTSD
jgi:hypothetical protein